MRAGVSGCAHTHARVLATQLARARLIERMRTSVWVRVRYGRVTGRSAGGERSGAWRQQRAVVWCVPSVHKDNTASHHSQITGVSLGELAAAA